MGEAFRCKTPSSILIVGPSGCGKTCFTESLLLDHLEELFVNPPTTIHYCYGAWQDRFRDMRDAGVQPHEGVPITFHLQKWFPKGGLLVLDDLMVEGGEDKELLDLFTKHSHHHLPKQNTIRQMNYIAINSSIWTTNSQSLSDFEICCSMFDFSGHALLLYLIFIY